MNLINRDTDLYHKHIILTHPIITTTHTDHDTSNLHTAHDTSTLHTEAERSDAEVDDDDSHRSSREEELDARSREEEHAVEEAEATHVEDLSSEALEEATHRGYAEVDEASTEASHDTSRGIL